MSDKQKNHEADIKNPNKGTSGTNETYDKNQGNRGKQLDPKQQPPVPPKGKDK
jgi:hypothetical protein